MIWPAGKFVPLVYRGITVCAAELTTGLTTMVPAGDRSPARKNRSFVDCALADPAHIINIAQSTIRSRDCVIIVVPHLRAALRRSINLNSHSPLQRSAIP
jgi:hypothetical protein